MWQFIQLFRRAASSDGWGRQQLGFCAPRFTYTLTCTSRFYKMVHILHNFPDVQNGSVHYSLFETIVCRGCYFLTFKKVYILTMLNTVRIGSCHKLKTVSWSSNLVLSISLKLCSALVRKWCSLLILKMSITKQHFLSGTFPYPYKGCTLRYCEVPL